MSELEITDKAGGCAILVSATKEYFGYGRECLLTEEAQEELLDYMIRVKPDLVRKVILKHAEIAKGLT